MDVKILFTASHRGKKHFSSFYKKIYDLIEQKGIKNISDTIISMDSDSYYERLEKVGSAAYTEEYNRMIENIKKADVVIFECSLPSLGIGFMIDKSLELNKPVVGLHLKDHMPTFLAGISSDKFHLAEYTDENISDVLDKIIEKAKSSMDKRFNFFISPSLLNYLEKASKEQGLTKSTFIRNLLLEHMKRPVR